ncbi:hypothetical protein [Acetivibrio mesophilus]|uniref:hypothetical protein n=1 Tax=Acetivibrio mesophilus TaxID=2487273 RepID=UPI001F2106A1|nr:hypothetical protein [Acetivibrio mesophilus]
MFKTLRNPSIVLKAFNEKALDTSYQFSRLYRNLNNPNSYLMAYSNIYSNSGSITKGLDDKTLSGISNNRINNIILRLKNHSYKPTPVRRELIPKKNGKHVLLGYLRLMINWFKKL